MSQEETSKSYKKNDLIAVIKKDDKKDPVCLFQVLFPLITHKNYHKLSSPKMRTSSQRK